MIGRINASLIYSVRNAMNILFLFQVKEAAEGLQEGVIALACGSYRRGKTTCGDVDVLVTHPDGKSHKGLFGKLLAKLKEQGRQRWVLAVYMQLY